MKTLENIQNVNSNAANVASNNNKINDFGQKIGGARKDLYQAAHEWAAQLADITAEALTKAGGVSKLVRLPNLEKLTEAGAITADQARAALIIWRGIERKPQGSYRADRWAERTRARLEAAAAVITATEPQGEDVADIIRAARESAEFAVITAAQWPAEPFTFGNYTVSYSLYSEPRKLRIIGGRYYRGEASTDPADIVRQLREMTAADAEKAAESRARGPRLGVYHTSDFTRYFIAVENKCEIVLKVCDTYQEATEAARNERAELLAKYENLKSFPALRRSWNRPRVGKEWHAEDVTPEQFAAAIPFKGVEFGNWLNQDERAALLNSAFDGFHDLADLLGIAPAAVSLGGMLNFSFATRGHAGSAAHFDSCYNTINLNKRNGAGCMAHEWLHACDHFAAVLAGRGSCTSWGEAFATECNKESNHPADIAARELVAAIRKMDYYTRSRNYQTISGKSQGGADYYTQPCELAARGFEGVVLYLLNCAGGCSDFLVNLQSWRDFERDDAGHRRDCYPYPSDAEAAALVPYYVAFFRALFGSCQVSKKAAEGVAAATLQAAEEKAEADRRAAEKAEQERKESEERRAARRAELDRKAEEQRKENERKAEEIKQKAAHAVELLRDVLTARHFDTIATGYDSATAYAVAHLEGEIYTLSADIKTADEQGRPYVANRPAACVSYKYIHNAKRIICRRWQGASIRSNKRTARELVESLGAVDVRDIVRTFADFEKADTWQAAAHLWDATQRLHEAQGRRASEATEKPATGTKAAEGTDTKPATADGLTMEKYSEKATVIRGYNADQLAELLAMGGKEWRNLKGGKGVIFSTRRHADELAAWMEKQQGEGTTAPAADQPAESAPAATLQEAGEISDTESETPAETLPDWATEGARATILRNGEQLRGYITEIHKAFRGGHYLCTFHELGTLFNIPVNVSDCAPVEEPAAVLPDWLTVGARVRTRGRYMLSARTMRREWVEGEEMTVKAINADFVSLENRRDDGIITSSQSIATENAAAELTPIYSASEKLRNSESKESDAFNLPSRDEIRQTAKLGEATEIEPAAIAASIDTNEDTADASEEPAEVISTPTRTKSLTYQDQPDPDTLPADLPAELLKFYEVNRDASEENPAPVCLFYEPGVKKYQAFGSDAHLLAQEFGAAVITFTEGTEYRHGATFPHAIDFADFPAAELSARLHWLTREGYAVAVFAAADCLPTLNPAAPDWQERDRARRDRCYSETLELGDGVTRVMESERNIYDFHYELSFRYYKGGDLLAMFHATGYPEKWDYIGTIRPPHAGRFSNGAMVEHFATIWQAERYILAEIAKGLQPYNTPTDPAPEPSGDGVGICHSFDTNQDTATLQEAGEITADPLCITITREEIETTSALYNFAADTLVRLRYNNPECINTDEGFAYVWGRPCIDKAADALNIDRAALFDWCYNNSDFITTRVIVRAAIALSPNSPAPNQAHRLFEWSLIEERAKTADGRTLTVAGYFFRAPRVFDAKYYKELITAEWWGNDPRPFQFGDHSFSCIYKGGDMWDILSADGTRQQDLTTDELADFLEEEYKYSRKAAAKSEAPKPQPSAWVTDYTADDFLKLEANPEAIEADGDIMGKRLRHCQSGGLGELQVFIQDYAGNERHAIYYIWDEFMQEVRANVRPLDWLRRHFCPANGWHEVAA